MIKATDIPAVAKFLSDMDAQTEQFRLQEEAEKQLAESCEYFDKVCQCETYMNYDQMIEIIRAHQRGENLQARDAYNSLLGWRSADRTCWPPNFQSWEYRIKPQPREWYGEILPSGELVICNQPDSLTKGGELIKLREVLE